MYSKWLKNSIILDVISIVLFSAIILIHYLEISKSFFSLYFACSLIILGWILVSLFFRGADEKWKRQWKIPVWQILLWVFFFMAGMIAVIRHPDSLFANGGCVILLLLISDLCRNISRYHIAKRFGLDDFDSVEDLLSEHPEAGKYLKA